MRSEKRLEKARVPSLRSALNPERGSASAYASKTLGKFRFGDVVAERPLLAQPTRCP